MPLTHLDKIKLANHIDQLTEAFVERVPTQIAHWEQQMSPTDHSCLLTVQEKQSVVA